MGLFISIVIIETIIPIIFCVLLTDLISYVLLTPGSRPAPRPPNKISLAIGFGAMALAYILSLLRIPFTVLPYLSKLILLFLTQGKFNIIWRSGNLIQLLRILGDVLNLWLTASIATTIIAHPD